MQKSLKIAFYTDTFLPAVDGVVTSMLGFKKELERRGHTVYIFASGDRRTKQMVKGDRKVFVVRSMRFRKYPQYNLALFPYATGLTLANLDIDIIHAQTPFMMGAYSLLMAKMYRKPIVSSFHTLFTDKSVIKEYTTKNKRLLGLAYRYSWSYAKFFYKRCDGVIAPSDTINAMLQKRGLQRIYTVPNSVDTRRFNPKVSGSSVRRRLLYGRRGKIVLYMGRLSREKRIETLLKAAKRLQDREITFVIGGTGPAESYFRNMAARMQLHGRVKFVGFVDQKELPKYYAAADAFCIPSTFETQGIAALEALACGKPVVAADFLALKELVRNGYNGERFKPGDGRDCARKIDKVLNNVGSYKGMVETAERYSIRAGTDQLLDTYYTILGKYDSNARR